ncbi:hypothetical protein [Andreprevotia chitinilytica]|uniref:hypothetical protein n=1 Tax=Andreprevotia chitinilytica TaxID=396808 RepID=UPI0005568C4B|nr:hypothetical protein [Andreprevotia chitinilytica]
MPNSPHSTPAPPPRQGFIHDRVPVGRTADDFAQYGMNSIAELGRLFQILAAVVEPGSTAYQLTQSGLTLANERRITIDAVRMSVLQFREKDRK